MTYSQIIRPATLLAMLITGTATVQAQVPTSIPRAPAALPATPSVPATMPSSATMPMSATTPAAATMPATDAMSASNTLATTTTTQGSTSTPADSAAATLDKAIAASDKGDKSAAASALKAGADAAEAQAATSKGDFKGKLMNQAGNLRKLIPGVQSGLVKGAVISKAVSLVKMALGANQISNLLGGSSLLGSVGGLTSGLSLLKGGLPSLGGSTADTGGSLISGAMSAVGGLSGAGGAAAEPAVRSQLGGVLNFAKGIL